MISMTSNAGRAAPSIGAGLASPPSKPFQPFAREPAPPPNGWESRVTIDMIQTRVAERFRIPRIEMTSARRAREVARPRQVAMYLSKQLTLRSLPEIGRRFGGRDHTTVIHAVRQIEALMGTDGELKQTVADLTHELSPPAHNDADQPDLFAEAAS